MRMIPPIAAGTLLLVLTTACTGPRTSDADLKPLTSAQVDDALKGATAKKPVVLVDTRPAEQFAQGTLPGAINIPYGLVGPNDSRLSSADKIIVYGQQGQTQLTNSSAKKLIMEGYVNVFNYVGGYEAWQRYKAGVADPDLPQEPVK